MSKITEYLGLAELDTVPAFQSGGILERAQGLKPARRKKELKAELLKTVWHQAALEVAGVLEHQDVVPFWIDINTMTFNPEGSPEEWFTGSEVVQALSEYIRTGHRTEIARHEARLKVRDKLLELTKFRERVEVENNSQTGDRPQRLRINRRKDK